MAVEAIKNSTYAAEYEPNRNVKNDSQKLGQDAFLKLLVAEMKYQDPMNPMDNKESVSQMAQFSSLEQMENLNDSFQNFANQEKINGMKAGAEFIGKYVEGSNDGEEVGGYVVSSSFKDSMPMLRLQNESGETSQILLKDLTKVSVSEEAAGW